VAHELDARFLEQGDDMVTAATWYGASLEPFLIEKKLCTVSNNGCSGFDLSKMGGDFIGDIISFLEMFEESADAVL
jgi:hypothetical protein